MDFTRLFKYIRVEMGYTYMGDKMDIYIKELINGLNMGLISIDHLIDKIEDAKMRDIVLHLRKEFGDLKESVMEISPEAEDETRKNFLLETMIEMKTLMTNDSQIAKMLIEGCNQSVMTMTHLFNQEKSDMRFKKYMNDFEDISKRYIEELKKFL